MSPFRSERQALKGLLEPDEEILGSDFVSVRGWTAAGQPDELLDGLGSGGVSGRMVMIVTTQSIWIVDPFAKVRAPLNQLIAVGRKQRVGSGRYATPGQVQLNFDHGYWNIDYDPRDAKQATGDVITQLFFGRIIKDTIREFPQTALPENGLVHDDLDHTDYSDEQLNAGNSANASEDDAAGTIEQETAQVEYDMTSWTSEQRSQFARRLDRAGIPWFWRSRCLVVSNDDEQSVDDMLNSE